MIYYSKITLKKLIDFSETQVVYDILLDYFLMINEVWTEGYFIAANLVKPECKMFLFLQNLKCLIKEKENA